ncbi:FtsX-like permease family protein [bacterium]|nr:FtsX-like permease family protein [bacterium]
MNFIDTFRTSSTAISANKVRAALTMLGVIIGVFAVVMMVALGQGAQNFITDQFEQLGSNLIFVSPGKSGVGRDPAEALTRNKLDDKHVDLIKTHANENISALSAWVSTGSTVVHKNKSYFASVSGLDYNGNEVMNYEIDKGRFLIRSEVKSKAKVAVIGKLVSEELFGQSSPIGESIKMDNNSYKVIGTFKEKGQNYDNGVIIPYTSAKSTFSIKNLSGIVIKLKEGAPVEVSMNQIKRAVSRDLNKDDFSVLSQQDILGSIQEILGMLTLAIGGIAGISLLVGGIGIMNIMLVSVTERTREIGLRKAVGATPFNIASQFLIESVLISFGGGSIGIILAFIANFAAQSFIRTEIPIWAIALAFGFSVGVGILFGTYPAIKAAKKDPIEALRYE